MNIVVNWMSQLKLKDPAIPVSSLLVSNHRLEAEPVKLAQINAWNSKMTAEEVQSGP